MKVIVRGLVKAEDMVIAQLGGFGGFLALDPNTPKPPKTRKPTRLYGYP